MSLFRVTSDQPFRGPHQDQPVVHHGLPAPEAQKAMILVHGRGASAQSMIRFAGELSADQIHYRAIQASEHRWYPRSFLAPRKLNQPGISSGLQAIYDQIAELNGEQIPTEKIALLGFSQGGCLATEFAARHPRRFGAVIGLSGGLIGKDVHPDHYSGSLEQSPVFLGCSDRDPHIPRERVELTSRIFQQLDGEVTQRIYPGMGHTVNKDEITEINRMLAAI